MKVIRYALCILGICTLGFFASPVHAEGSISIWYDGMPGAVAIDVPDNWNDFDEPSIPECDVKLIDSTGQKICRIFIASRDGDYLDFGYMTELAEILEEFVYSNSPRSAVNVQHQNQENFMYRRLVLEDEPEDTYACSAVFSLGDYLVGLVLQEQISDEQQMIDDCNMLLQKIFLIDKNES